MENFESAIIEISGKCNAKCKWCITGRNNRYGSGKVATCLSLDQFKSIYEYLITIKAISQKTELMLYSWGEPFLNPEAEKIFSFLSEKQQLYSVSTNGSVYKKACNDKTYDCMRSVTFSLPGFSQSSYNRIHGFNFEQICENISLLLTDMRKNGFKGNAIVVFHVYRFNQHEINPAGMFADSLGALFVPYYAYFNGLSLAKKFVNGTFSMEEQNEINEEICLHYIEHRRREATENFKCPLRKILTIDEKGNLVICCAADKQTKGYVLGDIFSFLNVEEIADKLDWSMKNNFECVDCHAKKLDVWLTKYEEWNG